MPTPTLWLEFIKIVIICGVLFYVVYTVNRAADFMMASKDPKTFYGLHKHDDNTEQSEEEKIESQRRNILDRVVMNGEISRIDLTWLENQRKRESA